MSESLIIMHSAYICIVNSENMKKWKYKKKGGTENQPLSQNSEWKWKILKSVSLCHKVRSENKKNVKVHLCPRAPGEKFGAGHRSSQD